MTLVDSGFPPVEKLSEKTPLKGEYQLPEEGTASIGSSVVNLVNLVIGSGVVALPWALSQTGLSLGLGFFIVFATLSAFSLHLLSSCARVIPGSNFRLMALLTVPRLKQLGDLAVSSMCILVSASYLMIVGDVMPDAAESCLPYLPQSWHPMALNRTFWITSFTAIFVAGPAFLKKLDALKFCSSFACVCLVYIVGVVLAYAWIPSLRETLETGDKPISITGGASSDLSAILRICPIFVYGFCCHQAIFSVINELKNPTQFRCDTVVVNSIGASATIYVMFAVSGYLTFGNDVHSDVLTAYPSNAFLAIGRIALAINLALSVPLNTFPTRDSICLLVWGKTPKQISNCTFYILSAIILMAVYLIAVMTEDLGLIISLAGATGGATVSYILPGLYYAYYFPHFHMKRVFAFMLTIMGLIIMVGCVTLEMLYLES